MHMKDMQTMICSCDGILLSHKKGRLRHITTWMNHKDIMPSKRRQELKVHISGAGGRVRD